MSKWLARLKHIPQEATPDQVPEPIWNGGTSESGACIQCKQPTSAMITAPGGTIGWCCPKCFSKRLSESDYIKVTGIKVSDGKL